MSKTFPTDYDNLGLNAVTRLSPGRTGLSPEIVFEAVERLSRSNELARSHRLVRFLRFTITETLEGRADRLTEHAIGARVYDRPPDFDPKVDGIVRGEARRLRKKLAQYYAREGKWDPVIIEYRAGSYAPSFRAAAPTPALDFLTSAGEMAGRVRLMDWTNSSLGPVDRWSSALRTTLSLGLQLTSPAMIFWGPELITFYNDAASGQLVAHHPDALGRPAREALGSSWTRFGQILESVMRTGTPSALSEERVLFRRGARIEERYFDMSFTPVVEHGQTSGVLVSQSDQTQRVVHERRLRTLWNLSARPADEDLHTAYGSIVAGLKDNPFDIPFACAYSTSEDGRLARLEAAVRIEPGTLLSPEAISLENGEFSFAGLTARIGVSQRFDLGSRFPSGVTGISEQSPVSVAVIPIQAGSDPVSGALIIGLDPHRPFDSDYRSFIDVISTLAGRILGHARARAREKAHAQELLLSRRRRTEFFEKAGAALRAPLTLLTGPLEELFAQETSIPLEQRHKLGLIQRGGEQISLLLDALLDYSDIESGMDEAYFEPVDLSMLTLRSAEMFRPAIERAAISFIVDCPPMSEPAWVDRQMWDKIVLNLLSNAFKYTLRGEIRVSLRAVSDRFVLEIMDTGVGLPANVRHELFTPFSAIFHPGSRSHRGLGMGLAISRAFLESHGGSVQILSEDGRGTRVIASVPRGKSHLPLNRLGGREPAPWARLIARAAVGEAESWAREIAAGEPSTTRQFLEPSPKRIVIAEDNNEMREYLVDLLSTAYTPETVVNTKQALESVHTNPPDLILAEASLPGPNGVDLLHALRDDPATRAIPVILMMDEPDEELRLRALAAGAKDCLVKPFTARELILKTHSQIAGGRRG